MLDRGDEIREWYDSIMKGEGVLVDIGAGAYRDVIAAGVEHGLLVDRSITPPKEIIEVLRLFRPRLQQQGSEDRIRFDQVGRKLGYPPGDLFHRRCVELPPYFEVLLFHRNKQAHRGAVVTVASLCAFAGCALGILDLAEDKWGDAREVRDTAERALEWATGQNIRESSRERVTRIDRELDQEEGSRTKLRPRVPTDDPIGRRVGSVVREKIQPLVRDLMRTLLVDVPELLCAEDKRGLQDQVYCGQLGLSIGNLPLLRPTEFGTEVNGHNRYWRDPYGDFYVCSQWWKQHHHSNARSLLAFVEDVAERNRGRPDAKVLDRHEQAFRDYLTGA